MRRRRAIRFGVLLSATTLTGGIGCTHNHYYYPAGTVPGVASACDPVAPGTTVVTSTVPGVTLPSLGAVCDTPPQSQSGALVAQNSAKTTPIVSNAARPIAPRPIYSQPSGRPLRGGSGLVWRNSQSESLATTRIEGAYDDETTVK